VKRIPGANKMKKRQISGAWAMDEVAETKITRNELVWGRHLERTGRAMGTLQPGEEETPSWVDEDQ